MTPNEILKMREDMMEEQEIGFRKDAKEHRLEEIFAKAEKKLEDQRHDEIVQSFNDLETYDRVLGDDPVNEPEHYKGAGIEAIDVIHAFTPDPYSAYMANVIKYVLRHMGKGNEKQDLEKARWYLNKMIEEWNA